MEITETQRIGDFVNELDKLIHAAELAALARAITSPGQVVAEVAALRSERENFIAKWAPRA